ncbi:LLM class flavin-dependent oxidoreductase [Rhodoplanes sp. TEM]|uniref:LLM class flavin-dependent oxidoreductase n=1 Tax=Rhodoplanes tepidamans TaxID=200616 RepID=A0ABT5JC04_RHOTP|nr:MULTISPECIES: TIGR03619 family F420-dependent LLM class oxidoreductase [Rhodoplanes]MDC7787151.1 LLM class flavin-dependent oxidoreductase [Rhodoplanes tepidamans]MDC7984285.1 LLM class flavin-dependent oxidoreductase [Rhodoplanes sp. TEM]MDQ0356082.1 putative F420-dependent oxidoreductase [Rhodoplanes tepidamans]
MKFSVCLATGYEGLVYPIPFCEPQDLIKTGVLCEQLGYDAVFGNDHITTQHYVREIFPEPPNFYDVLITLAMIGQATSRIRLGTSLLVMPMREPVYLAKQVATIDQMTNGRMILAVGLGAYREEFEAWAGKRYLGARRGDMLDEGLACFKTLTEDKVSTFEGKYYSFTDLEMFPKPKQKPFALYIGGHNMEAIERAARLGAGWLPGWRPFHEIAERVQILRRRAEELGRDPMSIEVAPQFSLLIGKTDEAAEATYMESGLVAHRKSLAYTGRDPAHQVTGNLVGSPQLIIDKIHQLKAMGVDHCSAMALAVNSQSEYLEQIHWFAEEIMPHCR